MQNICANLSKILFFVLVLGYLAGCQGYSLTGGPGSTISPRLVVSAPSPKRLLSVNRLLVLPVELDPKLHSLAASQKKMQSDLLAILDRETNIEVVSQAALAALLPYEQGPNIELEQALAFAKKHGADSLLVTKINNYVERKGSRVGVTKAASLNFTMQILEVSNSAAVWEANYHFKDQALSDNLFRIHEHIKADPGWTTAHKTLRKGFTEAAQDLAKRRAGEYVRGY